MEYLREVYPVIKGAVEFFMDFLVEHPNGRWLVTNPSNSPENPPKGPGYEYFYDEVTGMYYFTTIVAGATMDLQILKDLFSYYASVTASPGYDQYRARIRAIKYTGLYEYGSAVSLGVANTYSGTLDFGTTDYYSTVQAIIEGSSGGAWSVLSTATAYPTAPGVGKTFHPPCTIAVPENSIIPGAYWEY